MSSEGQKSSYLTNNSIKIPTEIKTIKINFFALFLSKQPNNTVKQNYGTGFRKKK